MPASLRTLQKLISLWSEAVFLLFQDALETIFNFDSGLFACIGITSAKRTLFSSFVAVSYLKFYLFFFSALRLSENVIQILKIGLAGECFSFSKLGPW